MLCPSVGYLPSVAHPRRAVAVRVCVRTEAQSEAGARVLSRQLRSTRYAQRLTICNENVCARSSAAAHAQHVMCVPPLPCSSAASTYTLPYYSSRFLRLQQEVSRLGVGCASIAQVHLSM